MYLAKHAACWGLSQIGNFYNALHHTTVLHAITKIERARRSDESVDALIEVPTGELAAGPKNRLPGFDRPRARR
jgi:chromosomal replication initiation ATPase DnaA